MSHPLFRAAPDLLRAASRGEHWDVDLYIRTSDNTRDTPSSTMSESRTWLVNTELTPRFDAVVV